jgi:hypothetical protein
LLKVDGSDTVAGIHPSKLLEYIGARRPIIAVGPKASVVKSFLAESGQGYYASDQSGCMSALETCYERFANGRYEQTAKPGWQPFTAGDVAKSFAQVLDAMLETNRP